MFAFEGGEHKSWCWVSVFVVPSASPRDGRYEQVQALVSAPLGAGIHVSAVRRFLIAILIECVGGLPAGRSLSIGK